jgi:formylglycine-generating enzyme required for sulfatase activity
MDSTFRNLYFSDSTVLGDSMIIPQGGPGLQTNSSYFWRVQAKNSEETSAWSASWKFTTSITAPVPALPLSGAVNQPDTITLTWGTAGSLPAVYQVQVSTSGTFGTTFVNDSNLTAPAISFGPLMRGITYYWQVSAKSAAGVSNWAAAWSFTVVPIAPNAPLPAAPTNGSSGVTTFPVLSWNTAAWAVSYGLQVSMDPAFGTTVYGQSSITGSSLLVPHLQWGTQYYWRVVAVSGGGQSPWSAIGSFSTNTVTRSGTMVLVPGGTFLMGSNEFSDEQPVHTVTVSSFYMDSTEVTQGQYTALTGANPSEYTGDNLRPVERVSWFDVVMYCNARSNHDGLDTVYSYTRIDSEADEQHIRDSAIGDIENLSIDVTKNGYRMPTEAEYEYAERGGVSTDYYWGGNYPPLTSADTAAVNANAVTGGTEESEVATKGCNAYGLYDMAGNVWEHCWDRWTNSYSYSANPATNPLGPITGSLQPPETDTTMHILRGGSWNTPLWSNAAIFVRSPNRDYFFTDDHFNNFGFRCVRLAAP